MNKLLNRFKETAFLFVSLSTVGLAMERPEPVCPVVDENQLFKMLFREPDNQQPQGLGVFQELNPGEEWKLEELGKIRDEVLQKLDTGRKTHYDINYLFAKKEKLKFSELLALSPAFANYAKKIRSQEFHKENPIPLLYIWAGDHFQLEYPFPGIIGKRYTKYYGRIKQEKKDTSRSNLLENALRVGFPALKLHFVLTPKVETDNWVPIHHPELVETSPNLSTATSTSSSSDEGKFEGAQEGSGTAEQKSTKEEHQANKEEIKQLRQKGEYLTQEVLEEIEEERERLLQEAIQEIREFRAQTVKGLTEEIEELEEQLTHEAELLNQGELAPQNQEEAEYQRKAEEDQRAVEEAERQRKAEEDQRVAEEAERQRKAEEDQRVAEEAERQRKAEEDQQAAEEAERLRQAEELRAREAEAQRLRQEEEVGLAHEEIQHGFEQPAQLRQGQISTKPTLSSNSNEAEREEYFSSLLMNID
jgi:hypothetical protein